jgi:O-antigen/teichoic acid export membrane protein
MATPMREPPPSRPQAAVNASTKPSIAPLRHKTLSSVRWSIFQGVGTAVIQFGGLTMLARLLEPGDFGVMAMLLVIQGVANLFAQMGLSAAIIQTREITRSVLNTLYWLNILLGVAVWAALSLAAPLIAKLVNMPAIAETLPVLALVFLISGFGTQFQALAQRAMNFRLFAFVDLASSLAAIVVSVAMAFAGFGVWSLVGGAIVSSASASLTWCTLGFAEHGRPRFVFALGEARPYVTFGLYRLGAMLANTLNTRLDQIIVGGMFGATGLGYYSVAARLAEQPTERINPIVTRVALPAFSRVQDDQGRLGRGYLQMVRLLATVNAPIFIALAVAADHVARLVLGPGWDATVPLLRLLVLCALLRSVLNAGSSLVLAMGRADWTLHWNVALLFVFPIVLFLAGKQHDLTLICASLLTLQVALVLLYHRMFVRRLVAVRLGPFLWAFGKPLLLAVAAGSVAWVATLAIDTHDFAAVIAVVLIGASVYVPLVLWLMPGDAQFLREALGSRHGRST